MKTLIMYNDLCDELKYSIIDGDYSRFNGVCFNSMTDHPHESECSDFVFTDQGEFNIELSSDISLVENKEWDKVAIITFIP